MKILKLIVLIVGLNLISCSTTKQSTLTNKSFSNLISNKDTQTTVITGDLILADSNYFKLLNLKGFAESYAMYDIVAKKWNGWGYVYALIELALGIAFLTKFNLLLTNLATFIIMGISIIGVIQSVVNKRKIQCACLGAVFNLPMSTVTIIEDGVMIGMSAVMIWMLV